MEHYKSWAGLKKQLNEFLCEALKNRITYFLTRYHDVHNSYGRASIRFDGTELVCFSWIEMYHQEYAASAVHKKDPKLSYEDAVEQLKPEWDKNCTYYEMNFLDAALKFRSMPIKTALESDNYIIKILAILDKRVGNRTLTQISNDKEYKTYPEWVQQFYRVRFTSSNIAFCTAYFTDWRVKIWRTEQFLKKEKSTTPIYVKCLMRLATNKTSITGLLLTVYATLKRKASTRSFLTNVAG